MKEGISQASPVGTRCVVSGKQATSLFPVFPIFFMEITSSALCAQGRFVGINLSNADGKSCQTWQHRTIQP